MQNYLKSFQKFHTKQKDIDWYNSNSRSSNEFNDKTNRPAIKSKIDLSKYDTVILAFPIWWNSAPKIMWNFVEQNDLSRKTVVPICTSGSSSALKS
ncbi:MAG: hypothetical protein KBT21_08960 [Treponema sp.]|nr:hypothetical protein [Candidatus Treponema merdequi]